MAEIIDIRQHCVSELWERYEAAKAKAAETQCEADVLAAYRALWRWRRASCARRGNH